MCTASIDLEHNGKQWILVVIPADSGERHEIPITDQQAKTLQADGVPVWTGE